MKTYTQVFFGISVRMVMGLMLIYVSVAAAEKDKAGPSPAQSLKRVTLNVGEGPVKALPAPVVEKKAIDPRVAAKAEELFGQAKQAVEKGQQEEALAFAQGATSLNADHLGAQELRASLATNLKKTDEAMAAYREVLRLKPESFDARKRLGNALMRTQNYKEAIPEFEIVVKQDLADAGSQYNLARCYAFLEKTDKALAALKVCLEKRPDYRLTAQGDPAFAKIKNSEGFKKVVSDR